MTTEQTERKSILNSLAADYGMEPANFETMVRAMCSPQPRKGEEFKPLTPSEFAAFLLVCKQFGLNPLTREIYAYPKRGGGVVPVVGVDGWLRLINSHPQCDGWETVETHQGNAILVSTTVSMFRKDRAHAVVVTEYLRECVRDTDPWKMPHRMLRHKAVMQAGRYAFGFAGIFDEDEGYAQAEVTHTVVESRAPKPPAIEHKPTVPMEIIMDAVATEIPAKPVEDSAVSCSFPADATREVVPVESLNDGAAAGSDSSPQAAAPSKSRAPRPGKNTVTTVLQFDFEAHKAACAGALAKADDIDAIDACLAMFMQNKADILTSPQQGEIKMMCLAREEALTADPPATTTWDKEGE